MAKIFQSTAEEEQKYFNGFKNYNQGVFCFYKYFTEESINDDFKLEYWTAPGDYNGDGTLWKYLEYGPNGNILGGSIKQGKPYEKYGLWSPKKVKSENEISFSEGNSYAWKTSVWGNNDNENTILQTLVQEFKRIVDWARLSDYQQISAYACAKDNRKFSSNVVWKIAYMFSSNGKSGNDAAPGILPIYGTAAWEFFNKTYDLGVTDVDKERYLAQKNLMEKLDEKKGNTWRNGIAFFETYIFLWTLYANHTAYDLLNANKNLILTGAPGTGKTYMAKQLAKLLGVNPESEQFKFVQFHPSYDYTDFVEGLRPVKKNVSGSSPVIEFERKDGVFKEFCKKALCALNKANKANKEKKEAPKYVFVIDEINRGEMSKIFGELFFSIDPGYRGKDGMVQTQYQNLVDENDVFHKGFYVPENVYIIGTMNDIDRSVDSMDFAMRRRFPCVEVVAIESAQNMGLSSKSLARLIALNNAIEEVGFNSSFHIGGAYFLKLDENEDYEKLWAFYLKPLLMEYLRGRSTIDSDLKRLKEAYDSPLPDDLAESLTKLSEYFKSIRRKKNVFKMKEFSNGEYKNKYDDSKGKLKKDWTVEEVKLIFSDIKEEKTIADIVSILNGEEPEVKDSEPNNSEQE